MPYPIGSAYKRVNEVLDFDLIWTDALTPISDSIGSSEWSAPGLSQPTGPSTSGATTKVWVGGGVQGHQYLVTNRVTTAGGRVFERSILVQVIQ